MNWLRRKGPAVVIGPSPTTVVVPPARQAWDEKRWHRALNGKAIQITGRYRVLDRTTRTWREFNGCLVDDEGELTTYIADPPPEIKRHRHGPCFQLTTAPWFVVHWERPPRTFDDGILYVERILSEAINPR